MNALAFLGFLSLLFGDGSVSPNPGQIADGASNTLLLGEFANQFAPLFADFVAGIIAILIGL